MIVLDLMADLEPQYTRFSSFYGQPFIWCLVGDFGGTLGMYAALENINKVLQNFLLSPPSVLLVLIQSIIWDIVLIKMIQPPSTKNYI